MHMFATILEDLLGPLLRHYARTIPQLWTKQSRRERGTPFQPYQSNVLTESKSRGME